MFNLFKSNREQAPVAQAEKTPHQRISELNAFLNKHQSEVIPYLITTLKAEAIDVYSEVATIIKDSEGEPSEASVAKTLGLTTDSVQWKRLKELSKAIIAEHQAIAPERNAEKDLEKMSELKSNYLDKNKDEVIEVIADMLDKDKKIEEFYEVAEKIIKASKNDTTETELMNNLVFDVFKPADLDQWDKFKALANAIIERKDLADISKLPEAIPMEEDYPLAEEIEDVTDAEGNIPWAESADDDQKKVA